MNKKQAKEIIVSLSKPSKMPCKGFSLPASKCKTGTKLRKVKGSVCFDCYAMKGCYRFSNVQSTLEKRLTATKDKQFVAAMIASIGTDEFFRWHDSGDISNMAYFKKIIVVCKKTPNTRHWLPTKEKGIIKKFLQGGGTIPENLIVRLSGYMVDETPPKLNGLHTSTVHEKKKHYGIECKAYSNNGECGTCRACWDKEVKNVSYKKH